MKRTTITIALFVAVVAFVAIASQPAMGKSIVYDLSDNGALIKAHPGETIYVKLPGSYDHTYYFVTITTNGGLVLVDSWSQYLPPDNGGVQYEKYRWYEFRADGPGQFIATILNRGGYPQEPFVLTVKTTRR